MRRMGSEHNATEKIWLKSNLKQTALTVRLIAFQQIASFRNKLFNHRNDEADRCFAVKSNFRHLRHDDAGQTMNIFPLGFHNNINFEVSVVSGVSAHHHESSVRPYDETPFHMMTQRKVTSMKGSSFNLSYLCFHVWLIFYVSINHVLFVGKRFLWNALKWQIECSWISLVHFDETTKMPFNVKSIVESFMSIVNNCSLSFFPFVFKII